jgi:thioredoxin 1
MQISDWLAKAEFQKVVSEPGPHVVVFAAKWCKFCLRFIEQAKSLQYPVKFDINLVDADEPDKSLWDDFSIKVVPTIIVFRDGKSIFRIDGRKNIFHRDRAGLSMSDLEQTLSQLPSTG